MSQLMTERLDTIAGTYDTVADFDRHCNEHERKLIAETCHRQRMLEVGCGWGDMTEELAPLFERVVALDGSREFASRTRERCRRYPHVEVLHSLVEEYQSEEQFEDIIIAHVLEHVEDPVGVLSQLAALLHSNGQIHLIVPNAGSLHRRIGKAMGLLSDLHAFSERDVQLGHMRVYDLELLIRHVEAAGLRALAVEGVLIKPLSNAQMQSWDPGIVRALLEVGRELPELCNELYLRVGLAS